MALTNQIRYIMVREADGTPSTGLAFDDFTAAYNYQGGVYTDLTVQNVTTLGTYEAPSDAAHIRIRELNGDSPAKGGYEVHFHNTQLATGSRLWLWLSAGDRKIDPLEIDTEVAAIKAVTDLLVAVQAEPGQGAPAVNATPLTKLAYLYKAWRNKKTQTATGFSLFADDASTVDQKATVSDDGTTTTVGEIAGGP